LTSGAPVPSASTRQPKPELLRRRLRQGLRLLKSSHSSWKSLQCHCNRPAARCFAYSAGVSPPRAFFGRPWLYSHCQVSMTARASARPPPPPESRLPSASSRLSQTRSSVGRRLLIRAARFENASCSMTRWGYSANMRRCDRLGKVPAASLEHIPIGDVVKNTEEYEKRGVGHSVEG
jgi:hypothetical protein